MAAATGPRVNFERDNRGAQLGINYGTATFTTVQASLTNDDIDRDCLQALQCPPRAVTVKDRLKTSKDKLLDNSIDWIVQDPRYLCWRDSNDVGLLWIKGGAGKGKTMISISLIEQLLQLQRNPIAVVYFFCQHANYELNTIEAILKELIRSLFDQRQEVRETLRHHYNVKKKRFNDDVSSWQILWTIWLDMVEKCSCQKIYVVLDALDECQKQGMSNLLRNIVRAGIGRDSKLKWLMTSRPLDEAEQELLATNDQQQISLEHNADHVAESVQRYVLDKVAALNRRHRYGELLRQQITTELTTKAEGTFLWVSVVCKRLENVGRHEALKTVQELPPGLDAIYRRMFEQLNQGETDLVYDCVRLLQITILAYRPLNVVEIHSASNQFDDMTHLDFIIDRCASFVKREGAEIVINHKSAQDFLLDTTGQSLLNALGFYGHSQIALSCLSFLSTNLKTNIFDTPDPASTVEQLLLSKHESSKTLLEQAKYAATFWAQHAEAAADSQEIQAQLADDGDIAIYFDAKLLEWLECLSLVGQLPRCIGMLQGLSRIGEDAIRFVRRNYQLIETFPVQMYVSGLVSSPQSSLVRQTHLAKKPQWLRKLPRAEEAWTSPAQTLKGHDGDVTTMAWSPDGTLIVSGSDDKTVRMWDVMTGSMHREVLRGHRRGITSVACSPDGKYIASGSDDAEIKLWDVEGELKRTLVGHTDEVTSVAFSPNGMQLISGSRDKTIKLWSLTGEILQNMTGHSEEVSSVAFSPDGSQIVSGSHDGSVKLWNVNTAEIQHSFTNPSAWVRAVAFSPSGKHIAAGLEDRIIQVWDVKSGELHQVLEGHSESVTTVSFSPSGVQIVSGSKDNTVRLWNAEDGRLQQTLLSHSQDVRTVSFSPNGKEIGSASNDSTIKLWDVSVSGSSQTEIGHANFVRAVSLNNVLTASASDDKTIKVWHTGSGKLQHTLVGHTARVLTIAFSWDGKLIASGAEDKSIKLWNAETGKFIKTIAAYNKVWAISLAFSPDSRYIAAGSRHHNIKLWNTMTGELLRTLEGHTEAVLAVAFSPDGTQMASASKDETIRLWDVDKCLKASKIFRRSAKYLPKFNVCREARVSDAVRTLRFSQDGQRLIADIGTIDIDKLFTETQELIPTSDFVHSAVLSVSDGWLTLARKPVLRLLAYADAECWDASGDQIAIGYSNGLVSIFDIDRRRLLDQLGLVAGVDNGV